MRRRRRRRRRRRQAPSGARLHGCVCMCVLGLLASYYGDGPAGFGNAALP
jgi:hypothetical protein